MNGVLEGHLVTRRNVKVTCPSDMTTKALHHTSGHEIAMTQLERGKYYSTCDADDEKCDLMEIMLGCG